MLTRTQTAFKVFNTLQNMLFGTFLKHFKLQTVFLLGFTLGTEKSK